MSTCHTSSAILQSKKCFCKRSGMWPRTLASAMRFIESAFTSPGVPWQISFILDQYLWISSFIFSSCKHHQFGISACSDRLRYSMRYSRMLEESSFANRKADYFWLLLQSSVMLLVRIYSPLKLLWLSFRLCLRYLTFHSCHPLSPSFPYIYGHGDTRLHQFPYSDFLRLQHPTYQLLL